MFLGNTEKVYMLDKAESNAEQVKGHPAWGAVWDIASKSATVMDIATNVFCASGMHLPNGSFVTFGGNGAVGPGGNIGSVLNPDGVSAAFDASVGDYDGRTAIRILNPCTGADAGTNPNCQWFDNATFLAMQKERWYSAAEPLGDGSIAIIGGFVNGGYVNRNFPNVDPAHEGGAAEPTYEFYPSKGPAQLMQFMVDTSGLNAYAHTFLMPSGKMFLQANLSTMLWDPTANAETRLQDMPNGVARVYPASGATAMLPLTPANNYTPTMLFCGGSDMPADAYGNYSYPAINTWTYPASNDCQRITPEPTDGSTPKYVQDDGMLEGRTMGQFIALPDGKMLMINGGTNGTAGYADRTNLTPDISQMPFGMSLAAGPIGTPAIYDPTAAAGKRWSRNGLGTSNIARLYHSSAILMPDGSVLVAGSNPNVDVNTSTIYPTTYTAEIFYPSYFAASTRPAPQGIPQTLSYGGASFDIKIPATSYSGPANAAAESTMVMLMRPGFTTHAMNMGQRSLQLNNTYTVNSDGSIVLHVSQAPPNPNILQPGPVLLFVTINGIPSNGTYVIVGNGQFGQQPVQAAAQLPPKVKSDSASGSANPSSTSPGSGSNTTTTTGASSHMGLIIGAIAGAVAVVGVVGAIVGICVSRRRKAAARADLVSSSKVAMSGKGMSMRPMRDSDPGSFVPLAQANDSAAWGGSMGGGAGASTYSLNGGLQSPTPIGGGAGVGGRASPYRDSMSPGPVQTHFVHNGLGGVNTPVGGGGGRGVDSMEYDPYVEQQGQQQQYQPQPQQQQGYRESTQQQQPYRGQAQRRY
ncbi:DUF1929-domain-containing protein [Rickenella mellea]|uniref:DUF1929-domain-containing protein n=1 Tax=Rickenella mellea TaxID=50990 RepID=A0A4Y7PUE9_9AGAM|nr:DUF1929-domain-containing protein [Rickenella mellea]